MVGNGVMLSMMVVLPRPFLPTIATSFGLRTALVVGAVGGFTSVIPIVFSPIRKLKEMPESEEVLPTIAAGEAGLAPTVTSGFDESGAIAGAGAAAAIDES